MSRYARLYNIIQLFDQDSLLLPLFIYLTIKYLSRYARLYNIIQFFDQDSLLLPPFIYLTIKYLFRYARLYNIIQFFDQDSLLPPPFTFLTLIMYCVRQMLKISLPFYIQRQHFYFLIHDWLSSWDQKFLVLYFYFYLYSLNH